MSAAAAAVALPVSALAIWTLLRSPLAHRLIANPTGERWSEQATPTFGGIGLFLGLGAAIGAALAAGAVPHGQHRELLGILAAAALLFVAGLVDDVYSLPAVAKLAAQFGAASIALATGLKVEIVSNGVLAAAIGLIWLVGMTNAFNLLDNMDGLAGTLAAIAATLFAVDAVTEGEERFLLVLSVALAVTCLGFLPFNFRPGKPAAVFMGDSGSQVLGFTLGALGLATSWKVAETTVATLVLPILVLAVPILDTALVATTRMVEGRPIHRGGKDHTSHRLVRGGLSEHKTVVLLAAISAGLGATSLGYSVLGDYRVTLAGVLITFALLVQFAGFLVDLERGEAVEEVVRGGWMLRTIVLHRRRLLEVLLDFGLISVAFYAAYLLVEGGNGATYERHVFTVALPALLVTRYVAFIFLGLYQGIWRFAGSREAASIVLGVVASELAAFGIVIGTTPLGDFPVRVFVVDALLCMIVIGASRFAERALFRARATLREHDVRRTLIIGAGRSGRSLLRELRETPGEKVVGFVDDDPRLHRRRLLGVPVRGGTIDIERILAVTTPDAVMVTIPHAPAPRLDAVVRACAAAEIPCRFVRRETDLDPLAVLGAATD
jgi:UDP-GlcNAc:undecaprenyl-phosphate/decaprenyl-phosphate GlcNAc-1-phosphate transferase